jgi:hypothetical protein
MASKRRATVIGINYYKDISNLWGCVNDAYAVKTALERHSDGTKNFDVDLVTILDNKKPFDRNSLRDEVKDLFERKYDIALFYFAGHGYIDSIGGFLLTSESKHGHDGLSMDEVLKMINASPSTNKIVILDCCHSGILGNMAPNDDRAILNEGVTILTASDKDQYASEENGSGLFTTLFIDALNGSAANLLGEITPGSVYAHIDQSLGAKQQRPIFKTNVDSFTSLRSVEPPIELAELMKLTDLFPDSNFNFPLDPSFEPESSNPDPNNTIKFATLQKYNRVNLLVPVDAPHMWHAAMNSKSCKLTVLGEHYWNLVKKERI